MTCNTCHHMWLTGCRVFVDLVTGTDWNNFLRYKFYPIASGKITDSLHCHL